MSFGRMPRYTEPPRNEVEWTERRFRFGDLAIGELKRPFGEMESQECWMDD